MSGFTENGEHDTSIGPVIGKRLIGWSQNPYTGSSWQDDEPLYLTFEDGSQLIITASGFHDSGCLHVQHRRAA